MPLNLIRSDATPDETATSARPLVTRLAEGLAHESIHYCQWKGSGKQARWMAGDGDIDLLVDRTSQPAFADLLERLDFKLALPAPEKQVPGIVSYLGLDPLIGKLIHVHVHYSLIVGRAWTRHYHVAIERAVLESVRPGPLFNVPAPEFELILFVIQHTLRHDAMKSQERSLPELERLMSQADRTAVGRALTRHLPSVDPVFFERCVNALLPGVNAWRRIAVRTRLQHRLSAHVHRPRASSLAHRIVRKAGRVVGIRRIGGKRLAGGGAVIALVGADGSGKSTAAKNLVKWLGTELRARRAHLGRPPRTLLTKSVGVGLKVSQWVDATLGRSEPSSVSANLELARCVCTARDRYRLYRSVRRFSADGGLAICERYPVPENYQLAGPSEAQGMAVAAKGTLATLLRRIEARYYTRITSPDLLLVLRVEPETAVRRKTDEPAAYVRARARIVRDIDWSGRTVQLIDAEQSAAVVMGELQARIWEAL